ACPQRLGYTQGSDDRDARQRVTRLWRHRECASGYVELSRYRLQQWRDGNRERESARCPDVAISEQLSGMQYQPPRRWRGDGGRHRLRTRRAFDRGEGLLGCEL